jgi:hypothetical protein
MDKATTRPTFADQVAWALANLSGLPEWFQVAALGRDLTPLGERAASVVEANVIRQAKAEALRDAAAAMQSDLDILGDLTHAPLWLNNRADEIEATR